ncbi:hypothetical protein SALBM311S_09844 [Streptomyces alboniger]
MTKDAVAGLKAAGLTSVKVAVDDSLFPEPTLARGWKADYYPGEIAPVRALVVDGHAVNDTSIDAGQVFAKQLAADGITVDGEVTRRTANITDVPVARHKSAKLSDIVHHMMKVSDSNIAETLLRMTALRAGQPATFEGGTAVVRAVLSQGYGVRARRLLPRGCSATTEATAIRRDGRAGRPVPFDRGTLCRLMLTEIDATPSRCLRAGGAR